MFICIRNTWKGLGLMYDRAYDSITDRVWDSINKGVSCIAREDRTCADERNSVNGRISEQDMLRLRTTNRGFLVEMDVRGKNPALMGLRGC